MTRHVGLNHAEVAHRWANDPLGEDHASGFNMFFQAGTIYSYGHHFPIARHVRNGKGECAILVTTNRHSTSTGKHCTYVRQACHHLKSFDVPHVSTDGANKHRLNIAHFQRQYDEYVGRASRVSSTGAGPTSDLDEATNYRNSGNEYTAFFGIDDCVVPAFKFHIAEIMARWTRITSPEAVAARKAAAERREQRLRVKHAAAIELYCKGESNDVPNAVILSYEQIGRRGAWEREHYATEIEAFSHGDGLGALQDKYLMNSLFERHATLKQQARRLTYERNHNQEMIEAYAGGDDKFPGDSRYTTRGRFEKLATGAQKARRAVFEMARDKEKIAEWLRGEGNHYMPGTPCLLRIKKDKVQTSQGALFPIADAKRVFALIQAVRKRGEFWKPNGETCPKLGHYHIDRIHADGTVRAGCHTVPWSSIERVAIELGLVEAA